MSEDAHVAVAQQPVVSSSTKPVAAPRKKRKRKATGGGAADDCFTCSNAGRSCDRRRPYCNQCLDHGRDCAGYKTTLTWGVGVASRGKLRGLALPVSDSIAEAPPAAATKARKQKPTIPSPPTTTTSSSSPIARTSPVERENIRKNAETQATTQDQSSVQQVTTDTSSNSRHQQLPNWHQPTLPPFPTGILPSEVIFPDIHHNTTAAEGLLVASQLPGDGSLYNYIPPTSSSATQTWLVPAMTTTAPAYSMPVLSLQPPGRSQTQHRRPQTGLYSLQPSITGKRRASSMESNDQDESDINGDDSIISPVYSEPVFVDPVAFYAYGQNQDTWNFTTSPFANSLPDLLLEQSVGRTPRMRYLISYFAEVIAPVIVAFDRPSNPYRTRILQMAHHSETLQHAIAALSASNIRQRREEKILSTERTEQARKSSRAHRALTDVSFQERHGILDFAGDNREEIFHKSLAIKSLNALLADPSKRHDDSVLASLLILCLFHICETGVAQFQTQFAGVRKLLAMRHRMNIPESNEVRWCTRLFTWFDAMTATINNREGQLQGLHLDMTCASDEEWSMENLAGCDGRLFKVMARLGRLNMLSQNRPVDPSFNLNSHVAMPVLPPELSHYTPNGMNAAYAATLYAQTQPSQWGNPEFWEEWHSIRQQLESWRLDTSQLSTDTYSGGSLKANSGPATVSSPTSSNSNVVVSPDNLADLSNISEAFRYAALLYTERLAHPDIPSTHPRIQTFVLTAMHYIASVQSDVYLLWPLFITGSECVYEEHRTAIRNRCKNIQNDSGFYNNISCLELLEKIWAQNPPVTSHQQHEQQQPQQLESLYPEHQHLYSNRVYSGTPVSNIRTQTRDSGQFFNRFPQERVGFRWRSIIEGQGVDGEYMVL